MILKQNFLKGRLNKDADIRLIPKGEFRDAFGIEIINSEGSDVGAIEVMLSNKQLTNYDVGPNPVDMGSFSDEFRKKIYWMVLSDTGSFLFEWDDINKVQSLVLGDTRPEEDRVFFLNKDYLINGIVKVNTQDVDDDLMLFTDDNMQPICINIERAKTYGINGFVEEDILLIKKPPRKAPKVTPTYTNDGSNNIEEKFLLFAYRYRYLDGEYSAPSDFSNYTFTPQKFKLDFFTLDNLGMINSFNAAKIEFNTGEKQVTDIQLLVKEGLSGALNVIETFAKEKKGWGHNETKSLIYANNKTLLPLPSDQLLRSFDNVPRQAKALSLLENIPIFSNYLEGYDIVDSNKNPINIDYNVSLQNNALDSGDQLDIEIVNTATNYLILSNPENYELKKGFQLIFDIATNINDLPSYRKTFFYTLKSDFNSLIDLFRDQDFESFIDIIDGDLNVNFNELGNYTKPPDYVSQGGSGIFITSNENPPRLSLNNLVYTDSANNDATRFAAVTFDPQTNISIAKDINTGTAKTNRNYEVGKVYLDKYGRRSTVLTSENNTLFIPQKYSTFQNKLVATINSSAPYWADRYKLVVKSNPLSYQTIYITEFYEDNFYTWCKLEGNNKDKINEGDFLIAKKAGQAIITEPVKIKVLEIKSQDKDFILNNTDADGNDVIERSGVYMKIKPINFTMNKDDFEVRETEAPEIGSSSGFPTTYMPLFSDLNEANGNYEEIAIPAGTSLTLKINSSRNYDSGWVNILYDEQVFAQRNYESIEEWFNETIFSRTTLRADDGSEEFDYDYLPNIRMVRGTLISFLGITIGIEENPNGRLFLEVQSLLSGGTRGRKGRVRASMIVRVGSGEYVFETVEKKADTEIFYETEQCFDIVDGNHIGNTQDQSVASGQPAIVEMDFFNCFTQGNGVESYRIRDEFNTNFLSIDTRPSSTSVEEYKEIRRFADQTYGKPFIESTNINGLNEFNLSTANFKELDKQYGSIQKTISREGNLLVLQEEKIGYVLFGKDLITSANGQSVVSKVPEILGSYRPYAGDNGVGRNPESVAVDGTRVSWVNSRRGTPMRLSTDGTTEINYGMSSHFRNLFIENPTSRKIGGYDPYFKKYVISIEDEINQTLNAFCGNIIQKTIDEPFTFILNLNFLLGETILDFQVSDGEVNIEAEYDNTTYGENGVSTSSSITIPRDDISKTEIEIKITPVTETATIQATNVCPTGIPMKVISIVLADDNDISKTIINRYRWGASSFFSDEHLFENSELSQFEVSEGLEGTSRFPERGKNVNIQSYKNGTTTGEFNTKTGNRLGYLITSNNYLAEDIETIISEATFITTSQTQVSLTNFIYQSNFNFNRPNGDENLYLIWDYINKPEDPEPEDPGTEERTQETINLNLTSNPVDDNSTDAYNREKILLDVFSTDPSLEPSEIVTVYFTVSLGISRSTSIDTIATSRVDFYKNGSFVSATLTSGSQLFYDSNDMNGDLDSNTIEGYITLSASESLSVSLQCIAQVLNIGSQDMISSTATISFGTPTINNQNKLVEAPNAKSLQAIATGTGQ
jgi:hypothetical protein